MNFRFNRQTTLFVFLILLTASCSRSVKQENGYTVLKGKFLDDKYEIAYDSMIDLGAGIDSIIKYEIEMLSCKKQNSICFAFNNNKALNPEQQKFYSDHKSTFELFDSFSKALYSGSSGKFNTGLFQLNKYWDDFFKNGDNDEWNQKLTDSFKLLNFGSELAFSGRLPVKVNDNMQVDIDAALKGILADHLFKLFSEVYQFKNFYINIGGTIRAKGNNGKDSYWPIKIEKPMINTQKTIDFATVPLKNYSMCTKTNFKKFHFIKGHRYSLAVDAVKGFPAKNELLSASIWSPTAIEAEIGTSACLTMGLEESKKYIESRPELKGFLIFESNGNLEFWASNNISYQLNTKD